LAGGGKLGGAGGEKGIEVFMGVILLLRDAN
jgi:hypothetical protein